MLLHGRSGWSNLIWSGGSLRCQKKESCRPAYKPRARDTGHTQGTSPAAPGEAGTSELRQAAGMQLPSSTPPSLMETEA
eukprot:scaffold126921_cov48-Phaeocystis_antarctica.AAC.4